MAALSITSSKVTPTGFSPGASRPAWMRAVDVDERDLDRVPAAVDAAGVDAHLGGDAGHVAAVGEARLADRAEAVDARPRRCAAGAERGEGGQTSSSGRRRTTRPSPPPPPAAAKRAKLVSGVGQPPRTRRRASRCPRPPPSRRRSSRREQVAHRGAEAAGPLPVAVQERRAVAPADRGGRGADAYRAVGGVGGAVEGGVLAVGGERRQHEAHRVADRRRRARRCRPGSRSRRRARATSSITVRRPRACRRGDGASPGPPADGRRRAVRGARGGQDRSCRLPLVSVRPSRSSSSRTSFLVILP